MPSPQFLSSYGLFKSAIAAFLETPEELRSTPCERDVISAFECAIQGLTPQDEKKFLEYAEEMLRLPGKLKDAATRRRTAQWGLDLAIAKDGANLIDAGHIIFIDEFLRRTGLSMVMFAQKLKDHKIFKMPSRVEFVWEKTYVPAFFADAKFDLDALEVVCKALRTCNGIEKYRFFTTAVATLGNQTPLDVIAAGGTERVLQEVKTFRRGLRGLVGPGKWHE
ncbi:hypothetical protein [Janthinobacterium sp. PAMC25594]|uniref:hypothetical protein n=1 Tax=Janthinobacterium sp. PAMC25594 TaxID=2861284 RepID=UPI001C6362E5|nr:hypothetical protein [Janthinobacterium sp. PAMC25594]QYG08716.1 hypothetical protein KY494_08175 [Janthinobacterium sp. PAMC25594]